MGKVINKADFDYYIMGQHKEELGKMTLIKHHTHTHPYVVNQYNNSIPMIKKCLAFALVHNKLLMSQAF